MPCHGASFVGDTGTVRRLAWQFGAVACPWGEVVGMAACTAVSCNKCSAHVLHGRRQVGCTSPVSCRATGWMGVAGHRVHYADTDMSLGDTVLNLSGTTRTTATLPYPPKGKQHTSPGPASRGHSNMSTCEAQSCASASPYQYLCQCVETARLRCTFRRCRCTEVACSHIK